jgi:hypothetical protein
VFLFLVFFFGFMGSVFTVHRFISVDNSGSRDIVMFTGEFLAGIRMKAIRHKVLHRALDGLERGILYLSSRLVDSVSSLTLLGQLAEIVTKLEDALICGYERHVEEYGVGKLVEIILQAVRFGYCDAAKWIDDRGFAGYLAVLDLNQPNGYRRGSL